MKRSIIYILFALFFVTVPSATTAKDFYDFTEEHPLIVACDWDFRPFEFLDSDGEPAGYNVEVLDIILNLGQTCPVFRNCLMQHERNQHIVCDPGASQIIPHTELRKERKE